MPTWRAITRRAFQCGLYEAQDVLGVSDAVDLISLERTGRFAWCEPLQRRLLWRDISRKLVFANPGLKPVRLRRDYDLFLVVCQQWWDLLYANAIEGWKDRCRTSVCWLDELWAAWVPQSKYWLHALSKFDHVFLGLKGSVDAVSSYLGRQCHWLPGAVDAIRFSPYPDPSPRSIDVYSIGRKWPGVHQSLLDMAARKKLFYVYDTFSAADIQPQDYRQHRELLANMAKRSRFFMVGPAKMDAPEERREQVEVGYRYFEGSAAGAVMIGQEPDCAPFRELFDWPNVVAKIRNDGSDVAEVVAAHLAQPERMEHLGRRNAAEALRRHDWVHRWKRIYDVVGIKPAPAMEARLKRLEELALMAQSGA